MKSERLILRDFGIDFNNLSFKKVVVTRLLEYDAGAIDVVYFMLTVN